LKHGKLFKLDTYYSYGHLKNESFSNTHVAYSIRKRFTGLINTIIGGRKPAVGSKKYLSKPVTFQCFKDETTKFLFLLSKT